MNNNSYNEAQYATMRTSFLTAFPKIFTDIEFSTEIFSKMKELAMQEGFSFLPNYFSNGSAVEIEARHKSLNIALEKELTEDILVIEIASGLSPRHLQYRNYNYYELDYNPIINIKKKIYSSMGYEILNNSLYGYRNIITSSAKLEKEKTFIDYDDFSTFFASIGLTNTRNKFSDFVNYQNLSSAKFLSFEEEETIKKINSYADIAKLYLKREKKDK